MNPERHPTIPLVLVAVLGLSGCEPTEPEAEVESVRPIKTLTLASKALAVEERGFPGVVRTANSSRLSFEVSGKVIDVAADIGDRVDAGQRLAALDDEPFRLEVQSAEADLNQAKANFQQADGDHERKRELREKGYVSASDLDSALAKRDAASNQVTMAQSRLDIAERNVRSTELKAPFAGYISRRLMDPHQEAAPGEAVFQLDVLDQMEVELMLSENVIGRLTRGDTGSVSFPGREQAEVEGQISEIGTLAETANAFSVTLQLRELPEGIYPGMTAEVRFSIEQGDQAAGFLLPATAIVAGVGAGPGQHFVFVYDAETQTVRKVPVSVTGGQGNLARVGEGLQEGDVVAVAGASFLSDGMQVRLLEPGNGS